MAKTDKKFGLGLALVKFSSYHAPVKLFCPRPPGTPWARDQTLLGEEQKNEKSRISDTTLVLVSNNKLKILKLMEKWLRCPKNFMHITSGLLITLDFVTGWVFLTSNR